MNSHLAIRIGDKYLATKPDTSVDLEFTNPYFNDTASETTSHPFTVPVEGNREIFGDIDDVSSDRNLSNVEGSVMGVIVDGVLIASGKTGNIEDQQVERDVSLQMVSAVHSLDDYLDGLRCRDVPLKDKICIGETIGNIKAQYKCKVDLVIKEELWLDQSGTQYSPFVLRKTTVSSDTVTHKESLTVQLPALGFSVPGLCVTRLSGASLPTSPSPYGSDGSIGVEPTRRKSYINVTEPYSPGGAAYCNARVSYMHHKENEKGESTDEVDTSTADDTPYGHYNPYLVLDADRPASGLCFYVLYFLDCLFHMFREDGIAYDNSELLKVDDMRRLSFFTTHCKFTTEPQRDPQTRPQPDLLSQLQINDWLHSRNIDTTIEAGIDKEDQSVDSVVIDGRSYKIGDQYTFGRDPVTKQEIRSAAIKSIFYKVDYDGTPTFTADVMNMYASSQNFPDTDVKTVLDSLWGSFGIRFFLDQQTREVRPMFIRDIFRDQSDPIVMPAIVIKAVKSLEKITGFRMKYGSESDSQEKKDNITLGKRDYDTTYDYQDYRNLNPNLEYGDIICQAYDTNMQCYVDLKTGNRYRIKIDGSASNRDEYHPVVFEVAQLTGVEIGDCSKVNEDFVEEVSSSFQPVVFNDVNFREQRKATILDKDPFGLLLGGSGGTHSIQLGSDLSKDQLLAAFVNEDMWHENIAREISYPMGVGHIKVDLKATIKSVEAYDVSGSEDGDSPLQSLDWGLAVAMMRGGGSDARMDLYDFDYDGFGNCKYRMVAGTGYTMSLDSIDAYSAVYDYNGDRPGVGDMADRFSLKIRAYTEAPYDISGPNGEMIRKGDPMCAPDVARRGLYDTFMSEWAHFILNRKKVILTVKCEVSALLNIQWTKRYRIGDYVGWINKISTHITAEKGIEEVTIELYVL